MQVYLHAGANCLTRVVMSRDPALKAAQTLPRGLTTVNLLLSSTITDSLKLETELKSAD